MYGVVQSINTDASALTPNMAGPAFDALLAYKKDGTLPPKHIKTESKLFEPGSAEAQLELKKDMGY